MSKKPNRLSTYAKQQIYENTLRRQATDVPYVNIGRFGITIPDTLSVISRIMSTDSALELPIPNASKVLFVADGIEADDFSRYSIGELQLLVYSGYMDRNFDELVYDFAHINNKMTLFVFRYNLTSEDLQKGLKVFNLYMLCSAIVSLYQVDNGCLLGTIYNNIIKATPLALTCYAWEKAFGEQLRMQDFDMGRFQSGTIDFISEKVLDIIYSYSPEYVFNFGILNDLVY